jgi:hypothetical protein
LSKQMLNLPQVIGILHRSSTSITTPTSYRYTSSIIDIHHYSLVVSHIVVSISIAQPSFWPLESTSITSDAGYLALGQEIVQLGSAIARPILGYPSSSPTATSFFLQIHLSTSLAHSGSRHPDPSQVMLNLHPSSHRPFTHLHHLHAGCDYHLKRMLFHAASHYPLLGVQWRTSAC